MTKFPNKEYGVAPFWTLIDVSATDDVPPGNCIGFYSDSAGDVAFESNGETIIMGVVANQFVDGAITQFNNTGTTVSGDIFAKYI